MGLQDWLSAASSAAKSLLSDAADEDNTQGVELSQKDIDFAQNVTSETFTGFPAEKLSDVWIMIPAQEAHAKRVLEQCPNLGMIRFDVCPKHMTDEQFWQIYFIISQGDVMDPSEPGSDFLLVGDPPRSLAVDDSSRDESEHSAVLVSSQTSDPPL
mmetsp:Transcript_19218/g.44317  ORF Transcript_19218/g.44317 Transcript_19218/m.44317 type:complete len:156 (+) Transcript_19218:10-477(+)